MTYDGSAPLENKRHEAFCLEYTRNGFNAEGAYQTIYGNKNNAWRLMARPDVKARIEYMSEELRDAAIMDAKEVLIELTKVARGDVDEVLAESMSVAQKLKALELLAKHHVLLTERVEQKNENVVINITGLEEEDGR